MNTPQIFLTCLASYNAGHLHGEWVDCIDHEEVQKAWDRIKETAPVPDSEEWFITDYDGFKGYEVSEYENLEELCEIGFDLEQLDGLEHIAFEWLVSDRSYTAEEALERVNDVCINADMSPSDYAYELVVDCYDLPEFALTYFDFDSFAKDLLIGGDIDEWDGCIITNAHEF